MVLRTYLHFAPSESLSVPDNTDWYRLGPFGLVPQVTWLPPHDPTVQWIKDGVDAQAGTKLVRALADYQIMLRRIGFTKMGTMLADLVANVEAADSAVRLGRAMKLE